jgi:hypothetical protein
MGLSRAANGTIYLDTGSLLHKSADEGRTWTTKYCSHPIKQNDNHYWLVTPRNTLVCETLPEADDWLPAGWPYKHVYLAEFDDRGISWTKLGRLTTRHGQCLARPAALGNGTSWWRTTCATDPARETGGQWSAVMRVGRGRTRSTTSTIGRASAGILGIWSWRTIPSSALCRPARSPKRSSRGMRWSGMPTSRLSDGGLHEDQIRNQPSADNTHSTKQEATRMVMTSVRGAMYRPPLGRGCPIQRAAAIPASPAAV